MTLSSRLFRSLNVRNPCSAFGSLHNPPYRPSFFIRSLATISAEPGQTLVEKIVQQYSVGLQPGQRVLQGDFVYIQPHHILTHDNTGAVMNKFAAIGASKFANPRQPVFALDHDVQNKSSVNQKKYAAIQAFANHHGIDFYPAGTGIGHQIMCEQGYALPYTLTVASDSHSNMYGGLGCLGTPVVRTDAAAIWCTGRTWWKVPPVVHVYLHGNLHRGVTGKDVILALCSHFRANQVLNTAVEFDGPGINALSISDRLAIANMTTEWGALAGLFPVDSTTIRWLRTNSRTNHPRLNPRAIETIEQMNLTPDPDAIYARKLKFDLSQLQPYVSGPNSIKVAAPVSELAQKNIKINKAYLVSCVNSRVEDLSLAAQVIRHAGPNARIAPGVEFYVAPASARVQKESETRGDWQVLLNAGAIPLPAGCGPCVGLGMGLLKDGEVGISATNRNFKGRMGSPKALAYLASPAVVTASALKGQIVIPGLPEYSTFFHHPPLVLSGDEILLSTNVSMNSDTPSLSVHNNKTNVLSSLEGTLSGDLVFVHQDNLNTDGIYPGKYTYQDGLTPTQMAKVVMENYDPQFPSLIRKGTILLTGFNFGTGSSREQAATALVAAGVQLVLAGSASETFKRNALNNGLLVLEVPALVRDTLKAFGTKYLTKPTGWLCEVRLSAGEILITSNSGTTQEQRVYSIPRVGVAAQELLKDGGLENWVKRRLSSSHIVTA